MQPPLFRKESTSELTAKTKGHDRIFTTKLGLSQSLMVQEGTHNLNVTLKGYSKKFWGLFGWKAHKTHKSHYFTPKEDGLSLTVTSHGQTYNPKFKPNQLPNKTLGFSWDGSMHSAHNTANFSDWLIFQNRAFSLVTMLMSISQSLYDFSQPEFHHMHPSHICICHASHILWKNLQAYNIEGTVPKKRNTYSKEQAEL